MSKITVGLSFSSKNSNGDGVDFSYHFTRQRHAVQGKSLATQSTIDIFTEDDGENPKTKTTKMDVFVLVLVMLVVILVIATVIVTARMCFISKKYHSLQKLSSDYPANDDAEAYDGNDTSNVINGALLQTEREVIPNRLYDGARHHVYEDARF